MAFGGYKFKGYKVVRANLSTNTYANWCLLVHQARIKAFMESCALSGAQWHFSKTNGPLAFESYGNVIYRVANANGDYHDYLSFFQYGDEELYYMIGTLGEYTNASGDPNTISTDSLFFVQRTSNAYQLKTCSCCSALSLSQFDDSGPFGTWPALALNASSQKSSNGVTSSKFPVTSEDAFTESSLYFGCATKGKDIITFFGKNQNRCCVESGDAFSALCDPDDDYTLAKIILGYSTDESSVIQKDYTYLLDRRANESISAYGSRTAQVLVVPSSGTKYNCLALIPSGGAFIRFGGAKIPYESALLSTIGYNDSSISTNGFLAKGFIKNELICINSTVDADKANNPDYGMLIMGGNMMAACSVAGNLSNSSTVGGGNAGYARNGTIASYNSQQDKQYPCAYVGWDPSNPNINDESSWPELALQ